MLKFYLSSFNDFLQLEKGLASTSVESYLNDLKKLDEYLTAEYNNCLIGQIERMHLLSFLEFLNELGLASTSQARMVSSIKSFFSFPLMCK